MGGEGGDGGGDVGVVGLEGFGPGVFEDRQGHALGRFGGFGM